MRKKTLPSHELRRIAVAAECDPRSVRRYVAGETLRGITRGRIERAMLTGKKPPDVA